MSKLFNIDGPLDQYLQLNKRADITMNGNGYNIADTTFLAELIAKETGAGFINTYDLLNKNDIMYTIRQIVRQSDFNNIVTGEIFIYPNEEGGFQILDTILNYIIPLQAIKRKSLNNLMIPLTLAYAENEKSNHAVTIMLSRTLLDIYESGHPSGVKQIYDVFLFEQHAKTDGSKLDYSKDTDIILEHIKNLYLNVFDEKYIEVKTDKNKDPLCNEENVCGIFSLNVIEKLAQMDEPIEITENNIKKLKMDDRDILTAHFKNVHRALIMKDVANKYESFKIKSTRDLLNDEQNKSRGDKPFES